MLNRTTMKAAAMKVATAAWIAAIAMCSRCASALEAPRLADVIAGLEKRESLFFESKSILLRYERIRSENVTPSAFSGKRLLATWTLAYRDGQWSRQRQFNEGSSTPDVYVETEPRVEFAKGGLILEWDQDGDRAFLDKFGIGRNIYQGLYYTNFIALDVPRYIAQDAGASGRLEEIRRKFADNTAFPYLPEFLEKNRAQYHVRPEQVEVDGFACWVVEYPGMDWFAVDPDHGFAIRQRRFCWDPGKPLKYEIWNHDYKEVKPGLWLPFKQTVNRYASIVAERKDIWGKVTAQSEFKLTTAEFDTLAAEYFDVKLTPGTEVLDVIREFRYTVATPDNADPFAMPVAAASEQLRPPWWRFWLIVLNALLFLVLLLIIVYRRWQKRKSA